MRYGDMSVSGTSGSIQTSTENTGAVEKNPKDIKIFGDANNNGFVDAEDFESDKGFANYLKDNGYLNGKIQWNSFKDIVDGLYSKFKSSQPQEVKAQQSSKSTETGNTYAVRNDDGTTTVFKSKEGSETETQYDDKGNVLSIIITYEDGSIGKFDYKKGIGVLKLSNGTVENYKIEGGKLVKVTPQESNDPNYDKAVRGGYNAKTEPSNVEKREINMNGVDGSYSIKSTRDGRYDIRTNFIITEENPIKHKFNSMEIKTTKNSSTGQYTVNKGGIIARHINQSFARQFLDLHVDKFVNEHVVYIDLLQRKNNGIELTKPEQKFMANHLKQMEKLDVKFDENGNIIDE